jgi:hypothetical protein
LWIYDTLMRFITYLCMAALNADSGKLHHSYMDRQDEKRVIVMDASHDGRKWGAGRTGYSGVSGRS